MKTQSPSTLLGHLQVVMAMCIVGSSVVAGKFISMELPVFVASFVRFLLAAMVLLPLHYRKAGTWARPARADMVLLTLQAVFGVFLFSVCLLLGLARSSALHAGLVMGTLPAVSALMAVLLLRERLDARYIVGIALAVASSLVLALGSQAGGPGGLPGMLLILGAVVCEALFSSLGKLAGHSVDPVTMATSMAVLGTVLFLPCALWEARTLDFGAVSMRAWLFLLYYALVVTVLGFILFYAGLARISSVAAGMHMAWVPLSATVVAVTFLGEPFGLHEVLAAVAIVAAVLVVSVGRPPGAAGPTLPADRESGQESDGNAA
ncbi:DMT family transporter [Massilia sp. S19_KUP03_FR1]|uniref:DMT family transporter n=1 Tax=Massilia sp. S19_KUP03_FR1 TaxID=3025503 RepID=UPI002FCDA2A0